MKWGWLLGALAAAAFLLIRRRALGRPTQAAAWVGVGAALLVGVGVIPLPNIEKLIEDIGAALGTWTYLLVGVLAFLETGAFVGLIAPGETTVIVGGVVAGQGEISLFVLIGITWFAAVAGDVASYTLGRRLGRAWLLRHGERVKITEERLHQVEAFFAKRGGMTILIGRFIGFVRALAPFIAGTSKMPLRKFLPYDVLGAGAWATTFCVLGYVFWQSFDQLTQYVSRGLFAFGTVVVIVVLLVGLVQLRRSPERRAQVRAWLDHHEQNRMLRPFVRLAYPAWRAIGRPAATFTDLAARFGWGRLTPGRLGLELTTLIALFAVGSFSFVLLGDLILDADGPLRIDDWAADVAERLRVDSAVDIVKVVTELGSLPVVALVAAVTAAWALARRRPVDALTLVLGVALSYVVVHFTKDFYDRDRPAEMLADADLAAYPSGHTMYAMAWIACATVLVRAGSGWALRVGAVTITVVLVAVVGLTRVYLRVHHLSDVLGGAALGAALWSLLAAIALVAGYVRHNVR